MLQVLIVLDIIKLNNSRQSLYICIKYSNAFSVNSYYTALSDIFHTTFIWRKICFFHVNIL